MTRAVSTPRTNPGPTPGPTPGTEAPRPVIAYLTGEYPRATDTFIQREVAGLRARGFRVLTATIRATDPAHHVGPEQRAEHAATFAVLATAKRPGRLIRAHLWALTRRPGGWLRALRLAWRTRPPGLRAGLWQMFYFLEAGVLAHHLTRHGVDHLHNHFADSSCTVAMLTAEIAGLPFSLTMHGPGIFFAPEHWRIDEKIARAGFVACISHFCRSQAMLFSDPAHWHRLRIVHCGVDPALYAPAPGRSRGKRLLFVGRLAAVKGIPLLLEALEQVQRDHPDAVLRIIGDGPDRAALEEQARARGLAAEFLGYRGQAEVAAVLAETDMLVLPSFAEGVPVVLMEAMAAGLPVVTTRVGGVSELVEHEVSGLLCPPGDAETLARQIGRLLSDPALCARMGGAGRARVMADFDSAREAGWLGRLFAAHAAGALPAGLRPDAETDMGAGTGTGAGTGA